MDKCSCGAAVVVDSVIPDSSGWLAHCYAGHNLFLYDLSSSPLIVEDVETRRV